MTIELPASVEAPLRALARREKRNIEALVEEAVRMFLDTAAITDLDAADVAETQLALIGELRGIEPWEDGNG